MLSTMQVVHTSKTVEGQVYIPEANYMLLIVSVVALAGFQNGNLIGNALSMTLPPPPTPPSPPSPFLLLPFGRNLAETSTSGQIELPRTSNKQLALSMSVSKMSPTWVLMQERSSKNDVNSTLFERCKQIGHRRTCLLLDTSTQSICVPVSKSRCSSQPWHLLCTQSQRSLLRNHSSLAWWPGNGSILLAHFMGWQGFARVRQCLAASVWLPLSLT